LNSTESNEHRRLPRWIGEDRGVGVLLGSVVENAEISVGSSASGVDDAFWDALMVKTRDFLSGNLVFKQ